MGIPDLRIGRLPAGTSSRFARTGSVARTAVACALLATGCRAGASGAPSPRPVERAAVETEGAGWTRVPSADLIAAGLDPDAPTATLSLSREGRPVSFLTEYDAPTLSEANAILFWAEPAASRWTDVAVYWVTDGNEEGTRIGDRVTNVTAPSAMPLRSIERTAREQVYVLSLQNGPATNFVWDGVVATTAPAEKEFAVAAAAPLATGSFSLAIETHGLSGEDAVDPDHHVIVEVNGNPAADVTFDGFGDHGIVATGPAGWIVPGDNRITLRLPQDTGAARDMVLVRAITLDHPRQAAATAPAETVVVVADVPGTHVFEGLPEATQVYDLADPIAPVRLVAPDSPVPEPNGGGAPRFELVVENAPARLLLVPPGVSRAPLAVRPPRVVPAGFARGAELLVVATDELAPAALRLVEHRRSQGISARLYLWDAVVDELGEGVPSPEAIAALVRSARRSITPPRWLLLFGDASHDPKELLSTEEPGGNQIPTFFDDAAGLMETSSDNAFVAEGTRSLPALAVGRIPAADLAEADDAVDKLLAYDAAQAPPSASKVVLVADDATAPWETVLFEETSESAAALLAPPLVSERIYLGALGSSQARTDLLAELADGALWVNYLGHGSYTDWAAERVFTDEDIAALPEQDVLPVYTVMNCLSGHFSQPNWKLRSLGEELVLAPRKGAIAVIASSALAYPGGQSELNLALVERLLTNTDAPTLGEALMEAKQSLDPSDPDHGDVILAWHLLGDPSMRLKRP